MTKLLASVRNSEEAQTALDASADIIDLKEPGRGALGALDIEVIREIIGRCQGQCLISATVGDLPPDPAAIISKTREIADAGVDYIKIGFFDSSYLETCLGALQPLAQKHSLVGVLFADRLHDFEGPCRQLKHAGFTGAMIDTADKSQGSVRKSTDEATLRRFISAAHELSLLCGIAGSLTLADVEPLAALNPDYLGFRTALCENGCRENPICKKAVAGIVQKLSWAKNNRMSVRHKAIHESASSMP